MPASDETLLLVRIEADIRTFEKQLAQASGGADRAAKHIEKSFGGLNHTFNDVGRDFTRGIIAPLLTLASLDAAKEAISGLHELADAAERAGISAEKLQVLRFFLQQNGIAASEADAALVNFNKSIGIAANTGKGPAAEAFKALGVSVRDANGNVRATGETFDIVVKKLAGLKSGAQAAAVSAGLFGRGIGATLTPALREGTQAIADAEAQLRSIGGLITDDLVARGEELDKEFQRLSLTISSTFKIAAVGFGEDVAKIIGDIEDMTGAVRDAINDPSWQNLQSLLTETFHGFEPTLESLKKLRNTIRGHLGLQPVPEAPQDLIAGPEQGISANERVRGAFSASRQSTPDQALLAALVKRLNKGGGAGGTDILPSEGADKFAKDIERLKARTAALDADTASIGKSVFAAQKLQAVQDLLNDAIKDGVKVTPELRAEIDKNATAYALAAQRLDDAQKRFEAINDIGRTFGQGLTDSIEGLLDKTESLNDVLANTAKAIRRAALEALIFGQGPLAQLLGLGGVGGGIGGILGSIFRGVTGQGIAAPSIPSIAARSTASAAPVVHLHVVEGQLFEPRVAAISGAVVVQHTSGLEARAIARGPAVARDNQRRFGNP